MTRKNATITAVIVITVVTVVNMLYTKYNQYRKQHPTESVTVVVQSVRILAPNTTTTEGDNTTSRAMAGAIIAGPKGALIGAATADKGRTVITSKVERCVVVVKTDDGEDLTWDLTPWDGAERAALLLPGDKVIVRRTIDLPNKSKSYKWIR